MGLTSNNNEVNIKYLKRKTTCSCFCKKHYWFESMTFLSTITSLIWKRDKMGWSGNSKVTLHNPECNWWDLGFDIDFSRPPCRKMKQMVINWNIASLYYIYFKSFGKTTQFINTWNKSYRQIQVFLFINWRYIYQGLHIAPKPSPGHRTSECKCWVLRSSQHKCRVRSINSKNNVKIWQGIGIRWRILKCLEIPKNKLRSKRIRFLIS